jgi:hypothetical protein
MVEEMVVLNKDRLVKRLDGLLKGTDYGSLDVFCLKYKEGTRFGSKSVKYYYLLEKIDKNIEFKMKVSSIRSLFNAVLGVALEKGVSLGNRGLVVELEEVAKNFVDFLEDVRVKSVEGDYSPVIERKLYDLVPLVQSDSFREMVRTTQTLTFFFINGSNLVDTLGQAIQRVLEIEKKDKKKVKLREIFVFTYKATEESLKILNDLNWIAPADSLLEYSLQVKRTMWQVRTLREVESLIEVKHFEYDFFPEVCIYGDDRIFYRPLFLGKREFYFYEILKKDQGFSSFHSPREASFQEMFKSYLRKVE